MAKTKHIQRRMNQRGIRSELVEITRKFGVRTGDRIILNKKGAESVLCEVDDLRKHLIQAMETGGLVLINVSDSDITTFRLNSYKRRRSSNRSLQGGEF